MEISWGYSAFWILLLAAALYTVIPDFLLHHLGVGTWKRQYTPGVTLTFDDGPTPEITPIILDVLDRHQVIATFFVIGEKALRYPELIKLIQARGHHIGAHSQQHRFAWFMSPWETWRNWEECIAALEQLTGKKVVWVRPPWGTFNLCTWLWLKIRHKQAVLWDVEGHDWLVRNNPPKINSRIIHQVKEGSIVLLHDGGGEDGAPQNTLQALDDLCRMIVKDKKLPLSELDLPEWSGGRKLVLGIWGKWENIFARLYKVERINSTNIFRLSKNCYHGPDLYSQAGQLLAADGDMVGEIHLDSNRLQGKEIDINKRGIYLLRLIRKSLPGLACYVDENPEYKGIQVFTGLTLINHGVQKLGFEVQEIPDTIFIRWIGWLQKLIMLIYPSSRKISNNKYKGTHPKLVWISRQQLLERWLPIDGLQKQNRLHY
ncbi:MAG: polysaccharide deacetylase family protein [Syntrophomonas sp.]|nr:polysaccharide deacetylase family protein [Syntrophomonas sp.]